MGSYALSSLERRRCSLCHDFDLLFVCFVLFCDFGRCWKDGNPMGAVWRGAYMACSAERNRLKLHIILHSTAKFSFAAKQPFIPTTDFAGNTLWSFITPRSSHLRTRWLPPTSLLLLPARFRSASRSLRSRTTPTPSPEKWTPVHNNTSPWQPTRLPTHFWHALWRSWTTHHQCSDWARPPYRPPSEPHPPHPFPADRQHNPTASTPWQTLLPSGITTRTPLRAFLPGGQPPTTSKMSTKPSKRYSARYASLYAPR